jgi:uncharacterized protein GlcG (DUF336 family)
MKSSVICSVGVAAAFVVWVSPVALALDKTPVLSLDLAKKIAAGCEAKAKEMSWKMNISVVDSGANQIFFEKMDGAYLGSGDIALHKAQTSARFPFPTRGIEQLAYGKDLKGGMVPGLALVPGIIAFAGGLPIMTETRCRSARSASAVAPPTKTRPVPRPVLKPLRMRSSSGSFGTILWSCPPL